MILPVWLFVVLVVLAAWGLFMLAAPSWLKAEVLVYVDAFLLTIPRAIRRAYELEKVYGLFGDGHHLFFKKKRKSRRPKGHARGPRRRKK